ncbi:MAG: AAA family ATPase [Nanoarchaeota archaeon]
MASDIWYRHFGFKQNPFTIKPGLLHDEVIAYDLEEIFNKIDYGEVIFIEGPYGAGKSTILKNIINEFGGRKQVIYYSANRTSKTIDFYKLLKGKYGALGKMFRGLPQDMILLIDEADAMNEEDFENLREYYEQGNFKSVLMVADNFDHLKISDYFMELVKDNIISLTELDEDEAVMLVRSRVGDLEFLPNDMVKKIFAHSDKNPRTLLKNCEDVCRYAFEYGDDAVTETHVKDVLEKKKSI